MRRALLLILVSLLLAGCAYGDSDELGGRIVLWHSDDVAETDILDDLVARFTDLNPDVQVSAVAVSPSDMLERYRGAARLSLGPDLFIGDSTWIADLADEDLIQPISDFDPAMSQYLSAAVENTRYNDMIYGIPYELGPVALYYNADLVTTPVDSLTTLLEQANDGGVMAMTTRFDQSFWGVRAFGGQLFDDVGRVTLDQGGLASWLLWMTTAQNSSGMFLNNDKATLINLFTSGRVPYYVGTPDDLPALRSAMGPDANIRVAPLPSGPAGAAGPLLHLKTFMFNEASAPRNARAALALAQFITNNENSLRLAREIGHVPANLRVPGIDARTYPIVNGFMTQARTAIPIRNTPAMFAVLENGDRLYRQVLDGVVDANQAATQFTVDINTSLGFEQAPVTVTDDCALDGELRLWHAWAGQDEITFNQVINLFERDCPDVDILITQFNSENELVSSYRILFDTNLKPDILLLSDTWVYPLASEALIQAVPTDTVQQFIPASVNALTYQNSVYGTPVSVWLTVLFYNQDLVSDPPRTLDDLITEANAGRTVALAATFEDAYWGVLAYGGRLFNEDATLAVNQDAAMQNWLAWLQSASQMPGFVVNSDPQVAIDAFSNGDAAYYVGSSQWLRVFESNLGRDAVAAASLPAGPVSAPAPLLRTEALMVNIMLDDERVDLTQAFLAFMADSDTQELLYTVTERFPANINTAIRADTALDTVREEAARAIVLPNRPEIEPVLLLGDGVYASVLNGDLTPEQAVTNLVSTVNEINNVAIPEATPAVAPTDEIASTDEITPEVTAEATPPLAPE